MNKINKAIVLLTHLFANPVKTQGKKKPTMERETVSGERVRFLHLRSKTNQDSAVTIAYIWKHETGEVHYTVARCSHGDKFCKKIGRDISYGRYMKHGPSHHLKNIHSSADLLENFEVLWSPDHEEIYVNQPEMKFV